MPVISVVMSVFNEPVEWISQSIESILRQTFKDFELIIVNDNPARQENVSLLDSFALNDNRIKVLHNQVNLGLPTSLNKAISQAQGKYIARMDADDISHPDRFKIQYDFLKHHPEISVCGTWAKRFGDIPFYSYKSYKTPVTVSQVAISSLFASSLIHPSVMGLSSVFKENRYNSELRKAQDYDLWGRLLNKDNKICNVPRYLLRYRITIKSRQFCIVSSQKKIAASTRKNLLLKLLPDITEQELFLHELICTNTTITNKVLAEEWLLKLKRILKGKYSIDSIYIDNFFDDIWFKICLYNSFSLHDYYRSVLHSKISIVNVFRLLKFYLLKSFK